MAVRKVHGSWWVDITFEGERIRRRSPTNTRSGAEIFEVHMRNLIAEHGSVSAATKAAARARKTECVTLGAFAERWIQDYAIVNNKPGEVDNKRAKLRARLLPYFGSTPLDQISAFMIERFKANMLSSGTKPKSVNNYLGVLRRLLNTAREWDIIESVPTFKMLKVAPADTRFLLEEDLERLLMHARPGVPRTMMLTAARTGLRFSELVALRWEDLDLERRWICVRQAYVRGHLGTPKNNRARFVYLPTEVQDALMQLPRCAGGLIFNTARDGPVHHKCADWWIRQAARYAGIEGVHWHVLRHTYASHLAMRGAPLQVIKDLLGHSTIDMTLRYAHLAPTYLAQVARIIEAREVPSLSEKFGQPSVNSTTTELNVRQLVA